MGLFSKDNENTERIVFVDFSDATLEIKKNDVEENEIIVNNINYLVEQEGENYVDEFYKMIRITKFGSYPDANYKILKELIEDKGCSKINNFLDELYKENMGY